MRILFISTNADLAGAPIHVATLANELKERHELYFLFGEYGPIFSQVKEFSDGVFLDERMRSDLKVISTFGAISNLVTLIRHLRPDVVHTHSSKAGLVGRIACLLTKTPSVFTVHGWSWRGKGLISRSILFLIEWLLGLVSKSEYIFVDTTSMNIGIRQLGLKSSNSNLVYNGVPDVILDSQRTRIDKFVQISMVGRVCSAKDHICTAKAFNLLGEHFQLNFIGAGTDEPNFISQIKSVCPNNIDRIHFLGSRTDVRQLLLQSDISVLTSHFEALPLTIIESMSASLPVVATSVGGIPELVEDGVSGFLAGEHDFKKVADSLNLLSDEKLRIKFGKSGRSKFLSKFSSQEMASNVEKVYGKAVSITK
jgi:glycosyltransferase involved in cell wall biosynthesis